METRVELDGIYVPSNDIVSRDITGELVIVPLTSGIGDLEDDLFSLNKSGMATWELLDGKNTIRQVIAALSSKYDAPEGEIEADVLGIVQELLKRGIVVEAASA